MPAIHRHFRIGLCTLALATAGLLGGCQSQPGLERSAKTADLLVGTRQSMVLSDQTVADSQAALHALSQSKGDLRVPFKTYVDNLNAVRKQADRMKQEAETVKAQSAAYCAARQGDVATISDEALRQTAQKRTADARDKCDEIKDRYAKVNRDFDGYLRRLGDLQTYLASELNYDTLASGQRWMDEAAVSGDLLRKDIRDLALQVELMTNTLSPVPVAVTQWTTQLKAPEMIDDLHQNSSPSVMASVP